MDSATSFVLLSLIIFLPAAGALVVCCLPKQSEDFTKLFSLYVTIAVFLLTALMAAGSYVGLDDLAFRPHTAAMQHAASTRWIDAFNIFYTLGLDGVSFPLVILTTFLSMLAMWASWSITKHVRAYCVLFLLLETGMLGVFMALDFFLFYVFWEVMLLPMYFLIGVWGGPRREYAAIKFFLFTLVGSVMILVAMLMLYFNSDVSRLAQTRWEPPAGMEISNQQSNHTFNLVALAKMGQMENSPYDFDDAGHPKRLWGKSIQWWAFLLLLIGFLIKVPAVPVHTWLPDAHVEAPTPISMILAGVLLKMGGYGILRICYPICPDAAYELAWFVCGVGAVSMVYGAFAAMAQHMTPERDFKRLVAYSSVSHMGYVVLGLGVWTITAGNGFSADYWKMGMNGAMFQMIAHGLSSAGMFFLVGVVYERVHHRDMGRFGGLFARMPVFGGLSFGIFFAALGLPGLCGFIGEVLVVLSVWTYSTALAVVAASVVILTAGYILWTLQRVYLGAEYTGPHGDALKPMTRREVAIAAPLLAFAILFGVYPKALFNYMKPSVSQTVDDLGTWMRRVKEPQLRKAYASVEAEEPGSPLKGVATAGSSPGATAGLSSSAVQVRPKTTAGQASSGTREVMSAEKLPAIARANSAPDGTQRRSEQPVGPSLNPLRPDRATSDTLAEEDQHP